MANEKAAPMKRGIKAMWTSTGNLFSIVGVKIKKRSMLMDTWDWVTMVLWVGTLVLMFEFIGIAATKEGVHPLTYSDGVAAAGGVFALMLVIAILTTVILRFLQKRKEGGAA